jgi:hypothetical protein
MHTRSDERMHPPAPALLLLNTQFYCYCFFCEEGERNRQVHTRSDERMHPPAREMLLFNHKFCCAISRFRCY